jgi:hypothetical protein
MNNSYQEVGPSGEVAFAQKAVDGNLTTIAMASGAWAWTLWVDLGSTQQVNKIVAYFANRPDIGGLYPTKYKIQTSTDGTTWVYRAGSSSSSVSYNNADGLYKVEHTFSTANVRYIRFTSIEPNAQGQTGVQMGIAELQAYYDNLATGTTALLQDNSGNSLEPCAGIYYASNAVDGDSTTFALAGGSYAWTLFTDLGSLKSSVNKVVVNFAPNLYATDYKVLVKDEGSTWVEVANVTGGTGGRNQMIFSPRDVRYVKVTALAPNASGQTGTQMAISELEVYN